MSIAIATKGYFIPATGKGTTIIERTGMAGGGMAMPPKYPIVYITDIEERESNYPYVQLYDIKNGNEIVEVIDIKNGEKNDLRKN